MLWENSSAAGGGRDVGGPVKYVLATDIAPFYAFVTNGVHIKDGELPGTLNEALKKIVNYSTGTPHM